MTSHDSWDANYSHYDTYWIVADIVPDGVVPSKCEATEDAARSHMDGELYTEDTCDAILLQSDRCLERGQRLRWDEVLNDRSITVMADR